MEYRQEGGQRVYTIAEGSDLRGFVVIDTEIGGRSRGGLRLVTDLSEPELRDAARSMTLKYGYLGLPQGGAKAGVRGDGEAPREARRRQLLEFARAIEPLLRDETYIPEADMGTQADDIRDVLCAVGVRIKRREGHDRRSGYYTARSCVASARAAVEHLGGTLAEATVAIEGFGKVGSAVAGLMSSSGARVVAVSTSSGAIYDPHGLDVNRLLRLHSHAGPEIVSRYDPARSLERDALLELPVDVLCPCARHHNVNAANAARVKARVVCAGANNPLSPSAEQSLGERGRLCLPDFVTNCGGVLGGTMEFARVSRAHIESLIDGHLGRRVASLLRQAQQQEVTPRALAEGFALRRFEGVHAAASNPGWSDRIFGVGLECHRRGWVPGPLVGALAFRYFDRLLASACL